MKTALVEAVVDDDQTVFFLLILPINPTTPVPNNQKS
jgi:hypothetical protein